LVLDVIQVVLEFEEGILFGGAVALPDQPPAGQGLGDGAAGPAGADDEGAALEEGLGQGQGVEAAASPRAFLFHRASATSRAPFTADKSSATTSKPLSEKGKGNRSGHKSGITRNG
jgi:hypothetical protein